MLLEEDQNERAESNTPYHISVLTTEYLAHGLDSKSYCAFEAANETHIGEVDASGFVLADAIVQSYGMLNAPTRTFANWRIPSMRHVLAILADDIEAQEAMLDFWSDFSVPFKSMIYCGPLLIEGTMFSEDNEPPEFYRQAFRPIEDATLTHLLNSEAAPITVRLGLINMFHVHGFHVEAN